jgi:4-amino-4-deoxy-L-arabinose transferase-like glycosyltransferase
VPWATFLGVFALIVRLPLMFDSRPVVAPDGLGYMGIADSVVSGHGFTSAGLLRPPVYPLFIALLHVFPGPTQNAVVVAQHVVGVAFVVGMALITWHFFGKPAGVVAGVVTAVSPQLVEAEHAVLSDFLLSVFILLGTALLARELTAGSRSRLRLGAVGMLFGMATLIKPVGQVLVLLAPLALLLVVREWKAVVRGTLLVTAGMALVVVPWVVRNEVDYGHAVVSTLGDEAMFWRVFDGDHLPFVGSDADTRMARSRYAAYAAGRGPPVNVWSFLQALVDKGYTPYAAGVRERSMALRAIVADPGRYLKDSANDFQAYATHADPTFTAARPELLASFARAVTGAPGVIQRPVASLSWRALTVAPRIVGLWWVLSLCGLGGLLLLLGPGTRTRKPERVAIVTFFSAWLLVGAAIALTAIPDIRYSLAGMPLLWVMGSAGLVFVVRALWAAVKEPTAWRAAARTSDE